MASNDEKPMTLPQLFNYLSDIKTGQLTDDNENLELIYHIICCDGM